MARVLEDETHRSRFGLWPIIDRRRCQIQLWRVGFDQVSRLLGQP